MKALIILLVASAALLAQPPGPGGPGGRSRGGPPPQSTGLSGLSGPSGTWWRDPSTVQRIGLTAEQQKKIEDAFQASRVHLIDLTASLEKEEVTMEPLLAADHPDEAKVLVQIDRIAQARAELEKANARMLLSFRSVLSQDQWTRLKSDRPSGPPQGRGPGGPPRGGGGR